MKTLMNGLTDFLKIDIWDIFWNSLVAICHLVYITPNLVRVVKNLQSSQNRVLLEITQI